MRTWFVALASLLVACAPTPENNAADASVFTLDPTGNWTVVYSFDAACGNPASTSNGTFTVTVGPMGYDIEVAGVISQGILACGSDSCRLSGTWAWRTTDTAYQQSMNLTLTTASAVTGNGTEAVVTATSNCTYPFTVTGTRM